MYALTLNWLWLYVFKYNTLTLKTITYYLTFRKKQIVLITIKRNLIENTFLSKVYYYSGFNIVDNTSHTLLDCICKVNIYSDNCQ